MLIAVPDLSHGHGGEGQSPVQQGFQMGGHAVGIEGEAPDQELAVQDLLQDLPHIVVVDAGPAVAHAGEAACAVFDVPVDDVDRGDLLGLLLPHPLQKGPGDMQGVAVFPFWAAVQNQNLHAFLQ